MGSDYFSSCCEGTFLLKKEKQSSEGTFLLKRKKQSFVHGSVTESHCLGKLTYARKDTYSQTFRRYNKSVVKTSFM